jgi:transcriptional regulator
MLYQPPHFAVAQRDVALELMRRHPLATLVSGGAAGAEPAVSHAPLIAQPDGEALMLLGHLAKPNPQWKAWQDGDGVLAIFHGPDAYVSPFSYETPVAVPTWNYAVVHAAGTVRLAHDSETKERALKALIDAHDLPYHARWDELDPDWREKMKGGIVAFAIAVTRLDVKFKLGQNRSLADRAGVLRSIERAGADGDELAGWMRRLMPDL